MNSDIQSILAVAIVLCAVAIFVYSKLRKKKDGCGEGCGCSGISKKIASSQKHPKSGK